MIELMTRKEMLERLTKGEDPFDIVLDKWRRIKEWLEENDACEHLPNNCHK